MAVSRIASKPMMFPSNVHITLDAGNTIKVKGPKGVLENALHAVVRIVLSNDGLRVTAAEGETDVALTKTQTGTAFANIRNMIIGVTDGFQSELELHGVGYKAKASGKLLELNLGFSHLIRYQIPEGIVVQTPAPNRIILSGINKQLLGRVAAEIRGYRPPEPYKGKGVRYLGEFIARKATNKK